MIAAAEEAASDSTEQGPFTRILLASEGRPISDAAVARTIQLAKEGHGSVRVFSVARIHGVSFGMPNPGLLPNKREWGEQRDIVAKAIKKLNRKGIKADGHVVGTRAGWKRIIDEGKKHECEAIVMSADPDRFRLVADMMWTQEPQRVRRKAKVPVYLVVDE